MTNIKSFNITTAAEADNALEGVRVRMSVTSMFVNMALDEALEEIRNLADTNKPSTYVKPDRYCGLQDYNAEKYRNIVTSENYRDAITREFSRNAETKWNIKEECVGTTNEDVAKMWIAFFDHVKDVNKAVRNHAEASNDYGRVANEYGNVVRDSKDLLGTYVGVSTGRRNARGWVVKGRGDTIHILKDPWPLSQYEIKQRPGVEVLPPGNILEPQFAWDVEQNTIRFTRSKTSLEVILPKAVAKQRRNLAITWWSQYQAAKAEGDKLFATRANWINRGGKRAKEKKITIEAEAATGLKYDPVRYLYGQNEAWVKGVQSVMAEDAALNARIRDAIVKEFIERAGGALSEAEQTLVDSEPADSYETQMDAMKAALEAIRNPKPVVVHTANAEEEEVGTIYEVVLSSKENE